MFLLIINTIIIIMMFFVLSRIIKLREKMREFKKSAATQQKQDGLMIMNQQIRIGQLVNKLSKYERKRDPETGRFIKDD